MIIFKRKTERVLNDLDMYISGLGSEPIKLLEREIAAWGEYSYDELESLIADGRLNEYIDWQARYSTLINETLSPMWIAAAVAAAKKATKGKIVLYDSDIDVKNYFLKRGGELITQLSEESRKAVAQVILYGQSQRQAPREIARTVRPLIGLNQRQAQANLNYRDKVYEQLREAGMSRAAAHKRADEAALKFASRQHRDRAETIVHTELAFAYNRGADIGVRRAISQGLMGRCAMKWTTAGTNRVCARCLDLKDKIVGYTDQSGVTLPPLHPRCRCAIAYLESADIPSGAPKWRRQEHFSSSDENIRATNPNYALGTAFQMNCQKCVPTYEMRMRGYDVQARPTYDVATDGFAQDCWDKAFQNALLQEGFEKSGKEKVLELMKQWGDGARGEVYVAWAQGNAHVFVAENRNGIIHFLDPQTGSCDVEYYFEHVKDGLTKLIRMDTLEPDEKNIKWCCMEAKRNDKPKRRDSDSKGENPAHS